jgi:hypothetical protein
VGTDYSIVYKVVGGCLYTFIKFVAAQGTNSITFDATGLDTVGDGTGTTITNPALILQHVLANFVFNRWVAPVSQGNGLWYPLSASLCDPTKFQALQVAFDARMTKGAYYAQSSTQVKGLNGLNDWAQSFNLKLYWGTNGLVKAVPFDHSIQYRELTAAPYVIDLTKYEVVSTPFSEPYDPTAIRNSEAISYVQQPGAPQGTASAGAAAGMQQVANVLDDTVPEQVQDSRTMTWSQGSL